MWGPDAEAAEGQVFEAEHAAAEEHQGWAQSECLEAHRQWWAQHAGLRQAEHDEVAERPRCVQQAAYPTA